MLREEKLLKALTRRGLTLAIAESCTGGLLSDRLTNIPGSSAAFVLGIIAYSNASKRKILKVLPETLREKGAVSDDTARQMAKNVRRLAQADIGVGITGIAGPTGAVAGKPLGTVFIALDKDNKTTAGRFHFPGKRRQIKRKASDKAISLILKFIQ